MTKQIAFSTRSEDVLATGRGIAAVVDDLNDQPSVICGVAHLGAEAPHGADQTESYFTQIESAGERATEITRQLLVPDSLGPRSTSAHEH